MSKRSGFVLPSPAQRSYLAQAVSLYSESVDHVLPYLERRGISEAAAEEYQLGYVEDPLDEDHEKFAGMLAIPYITDAGPLGIKFRCIEDHVCKDYRHSKYNKLKDEPGYLFGAWTLNEGGSDVCLAVEGELDQIVAWTEVGYPAVGIPGATQWSSHWSYVFDGYTEVVVIRDGDVEKTLRGKDGKERVIPPASDAFVRQLVENLPSTRVVRLPDGEDTSSYVLDYGVDKFKEVARLR